MNPEPLQGRHRTGWDPTCLPPLPGIQKKLLRSPVAYATG